MVEEGIVSNQLVLVPVESERNSGHPLELGNGSMAPQVQLPGKLAIVLDGWLYFSMGWLSVNASISYLPVPKSIDVMGATFLPKSVLVIPSNPISMVELVAKYLMAIAPDE